MKPCQDSLDAAIARFYNSVAYWWFVGFAIATNAVLLWFIVKGATP